MDETKHVTLLHTDNKKMVQIHSVLIFIVSR
jgi:hypothetical protein